MTARPPGQSVAGSKDLARRCARIVAALHLGRQGDIREIRPLAGGVSSDIALVVLPDRRICVKFALDRLRVSEVWHAPVRRNRAEYDWLELAAGIVPGAVPALLGRSAAENGFAMEFVEGKDTSLWKDELLAGRIDPARARAVGAVLGRLHAASTAPGFDAARFDNHGDFHSLRLEPYLRFTATRHPDLAGALQKLEETHFGAEIAVIHGDVSPKNILFRDGAPVFLDAECATMGDPSFDLAFCLTHLALKAVHLPQCRTALLAAARELWRAYQAHLTWEAPADLEARLAHLLPALMLARIDGKSPVEYLDDAARIEVREIARPLVATPKSTLGEILASIPDRRSPDAR